MLSQIRARITVDRQCVTHSSADYNRTDLAAIQQVQVGASDSSTNAERKSEQNPEQNSEQNS